MTSELNEILGNNILPGFVGAVGSYVIMKLVEITKEMTEIRKNERRNLTKLERHIFLLIPRIHGNLEVLDTYRSILIALNSGKFFDHTPKLFDVPVSPDLTENIRDLDIVNDYMQLILRIEFDLMNISSVKFEIDKICNEIASECKAGGISLEMTQKIARSCPSMIESISSTAKSIEENIDLARSLQAKIRIENRRFTIFNDMLYKPFEVDIEQRNKQVKRELKITKRESEEIAASRKVKPIEGNQVFRIVGLTDEGIERQ